MSRGQRRMTTLSSTTHSDGSIKMPPADEGPSQRTPPEASSRLWKIVEANKKAREKALSASIAVMCAWP
eukprot:3227308-Prymnesium_polylepis.1